MNTKILLTEFKKILALEEKAKSLYDIHIGSIKNQEVKDKLLTIRNDEVTHVEIAKKLIELVS